MEINILALRRALEMVRPAVSKKTTLSITQNVLLGNGQVVATNLEFSISVKAPQITEEACVPHRMLLQMVKTLPDYATVTLTPEPGPRLRVQHGSFTSRLTGSPPGDFPPLPVVEGPRDVVDGDELVQSLASVRPYTATEESRPVLTCVLLDLGEPIEVAGADGFRLAFKALRATYPTNGEEGKPRRVQLLVPATAVDALEHCWRLCEKQPPPKGAATIVDAVSAKRPIWISFNAGKLMCSFDLGQVTLLTQTPSGTFPDYKLLVPTTINHTLRFMPERLYGAVMQVAPLARDGAGIVRLRWAGEELRVSARAEEVGESEVAVPATVEGGDGFIAFNLQYLVETLKGKQGMMTMKTVNASSPGVFQYQHDPIVLVMPMFVQPEPAAAPKVDEPEADEIAKPAAGAEPAVEAEPPSTGAAPGGQKRGGRRKKA
jgi:DNA polymerase III sliding clamp (beta) subunit (PCNA family)